MWNLLKTKGDNFGIRKSYKGRRFTFDGSQEDIGCKHLGEQDNLNVNEEVVEDMLGLKMVWTYLGNLKYSATR